MSLKSYIIQDKNSKTPHYSDIEQSIYWNYQASYITQVPLSNYWIGPNIVYEVKSVASEDDEDVD